MQRRDSVGCAATGSCASWPHRPRKPERKRSTVFNRWKSRALRMTAREGCRVRGVYPRHRVVPSNRRSPASSMPRRLLFPFRWGDSAREAPLRPFFERSQDAFEGHPGCVVPFVLQQSAENRWARTLGNCT
jgi:hypothetical protein